MDIQTMDSDSQPPLTQTRELEVVSALLHGIHHTPSCPTPIRYNPCPPFLPTAPSIRPRAPTRILTFAHVLALASLLPLAYPLLPVRVFAHLPSPVPPWSPCSYTAPLVTTTTPIGVCGTFARYWLAGGGQVVVVKQGPQSNGEPRPKPELSPGQPEAVAAAQAPNFVSPSPQKPSLNCGFQAEPGWHITSSNTWQSRERQMGRTIVSSILEKNVLAQFEGRVFMAISSGCDSLKFRIQLCGQVSPAARVNPVECGTLASDLAAMGGVGYTYQACKQGPHRVSGTLRVIFGSRLLNSMLARFKWVLRLASPSSCHILAGWRWNVPAQFQRALRFLTSHNPSMSWYNALRALQAGQVLARDCELDASSVADSTCENYKAKSDLPQFRDVMPAEAGLSKSGRHIE
ncbi:hypothetical protein BD779DRAFT_1473083 [Infundibulicybe gibba]|nr:hypothetical protein BD779DRAFT_1473083 [Infundibulicybe gibba]